MSRERGFTAGAARADFLEEGHWSSDLNGEGESGHAEVWEGELTLEGLQT